MCTHNPRADYLTRVLQALEAQTLPKDQWEPLLIDNASKENLAERYDLFWHPHARQIREHELGLTPARLRGIREGVGELLVFVDDDCVLDPSYLKITLNIAREYPMLGAWGGQCIPESKRQFESWHQLMFGYLSIRYLDRNLWSNHLFEGHTLPAGAGMTVRRSVAEQYAKEVQACAVRKSFDRAGRLLFSCGDYDLAMTGLKMGFGAGLFVDLKLTH